MKQGLKLLGYYNYTVILTYIGALSGFAGIVFAMSGRSFNAILCLMFAGFCDMFDGAVASTDKNRSESEKCFGIQIDSLSDLICFGVLPAVIVCSLSDQKPLVLAVCALYMLCALIRLAYFNVDEQQRQQQSTDARKLYQGLPVTLSSLFLPLVYGLGRLYRKLSHIYLTITLLVMGMLFLIPFPLKKPGRSGKICMMLCGFAVMLLLFKVSGR